MIALPMVMVYIFVEHIPQGVFAEQHHLRQRFFFAHFIAVCSSAKPCEIGENLLSVSDPISRSEERLIHAGAFVRPPTLQRRTVSSLHPYAAVERSTTPVSPVPEPGHRSVREVPLPPRVQTLLV